MANDDKPSKAGRPSKKAPKVDEAARARAETELRNVLSGKDPDFVGAVLARIIGAPPSPERKSVEVLFVAASQVLADEGALDDRLAALDPIGKVTLALLGRGAWWSRTALVQAVTMAVGGDVEAESEATGDGNPMVAAISSVLSRWPILVRSNAFTRSEELGLFEPLAVQVRGRLAHVLAVGRTPAPPLATIGLGRTLLALALFPGLVAQRRPRVTRGGDLHAADATKLERALGEARGLFATWGALAVFEEVDGALAPIAARVRRLLESPSGVVAQFLEQRLGDLGWALASLAATGNEGDRFELGAALLAVGMGANFTFGFDVASLAARVERDDLRFSPLLHVDADENVLALPPDARAAVRGEPMAVSATPGGATGFVQPNYEVVLPPGVPLAAAFVVGCAAELVHVEAVARLKLTRESVLAARALGISVEEIAAALEAIAGPRGVPPAVRNAIEEWGSSVGEARVRTAVLFEVRAADALLQKVAERLAPIILDRPTPGLFVLSRAPTSKELGALRTLGVLTRSVAAAPAQRDHDDASEPAPAPAWPILERPISKRNLRAGLDPHRILHVVEASRPGHRHPHGGPPPSRSAIDPDDGAERPLPAAVESALEERYEEWKPRAHWVTQLRAIADSLVFRRAAATNPGGVALALRRAGEPQRINLEIARINAESRMRRASD